MATKIKEPTITYEELPDTIGVLDYMKWRRCGRSTADAMFHSKGFPRIETEGTKLMADKRAVLIYETAKSLSLTDEQIATMLNKVVEKYF